MLFRSYLYNLAAALQLPSAIHGDNIVYPTGQAPKTDSNSLRGLCPVGWHVPSGGESGAENEFIALDLANGGNGNPSSAEGHSLYQLFWQHNIYYSYTTAFNDPWKGVYPGNLSNNGTNLTNNVSSTTTNSYYHSSTVVNDNYSRYAGFHHRYFDSFGYSGYLDRTYGLSLRCVKDTCETAACQPCQAGYTLVNNHCQPTGNIEHCLSYGEPNVCSSCETGFYLRQDGQACLPQSQLLAACDSSNTLGTMQAFTAAACASYPTPVALEFTKIGCLKDHRTNYQTSNVNAVMDGDLEASLDRKSVV